MLYEVASFFKCIHLLQMIFKKSFSDLSNVTLKFSKKRKK